MTTENLDWLFDEVTSSSNKDNNKEQTNVTSVPYCSESPSLLGRLILNQLDDPRNLFCNNVLITLIQES